MFLLLAFMVINLSFKKQEKRSLERKVSELEEELKVSL